MRLTDGTQGSKLVVTAGRGTRIPEGTDAIIALCLSAVAYDNVPIMHQRNAYGIDKDC